MSLYFCPRCRQPFPDVQQCPTCNLTANAEAETYAEKLLETVITAEGDRAERRPGGSRTFKLIEGEPLPTSFGKDMYQKVFEGKGRRHPEGQLQT